jgi:hypothetical protein
MGSRSDDDYWNNKYAEVVEDDDEGYEDEEALYTMMEIIDNV